MTILSSFTEGPTQACGRRYVTEIHILPDGTVLPYEWLGSQPAEDVMRDRAEAIEASLVATDG